MSAVRDATARDTLRRLRTSWLAVTALPVLCAVVAGGLSQAQTPVFLAEAQLSFHEESESNAEAGVLVVQPQEAFELAARGAQYVIGDDVLRRARARLNTPRTVDKLRALITTGVDPVSTLVSVQVRASDRQFTAALANEVARSTRDIKTQAVRRHFEELADRVEEQLRSLPREEGLDDEALTIRFVQRLASLRALSVSATPVRITEQAAVPLEAESPTPGRNAVLGAIIGLILGLVLAFIRSALDRRIRDAEEIEEELNLPIVGSVGVAALGHAAHFENGRGPMRNQDVEAFRILRTNVEFLDVQQPPRAIVVTSPLPAEGKSTVAASLAVAIAEAGRRVLLVECDLRRPSIADRLGIKAGPGLVDHIRGACDRSEIVQSVPLPTGELAVVTAGSRSAAPGALLDSATFASFMHEVKDSYEIIIVDTAPMLSVGDAAQIISHVDGVLLCVRAGQTTRDQARTAGEILSRLPDRPTGVVVTGVKHGSDYRQYSSAYTDARRRLRMPALRAPAVSDLRIAVPLVVAAVLVGAGVSVGAGPLVLIAAVLAAFTTLGMQDWRRSIIGLLVFLPYSGLLIVAAHPDTGPATLAKDFLFVIPAYLGFAGAFLLRRPNVKIRGFPLGLVLVFAGLVVLQLLNPSLPNIVVGLIGAKVWLMYIPMALLGYHLVRTKSHLRRVLFVMCAVAVIPSLVGIIEGILINTGQGDAVYALYGSAAADVTQGFANVGGTSASISRVPSTFSFVTQFYLFTMSMLAVAYAYWRGFLSYSRRTAGIGALLFSLIALAAVLSGARGAILAVPAMIFTMLALDGVNVRVMLGMPIIALAVLSAAATVFGTGTATLLSDVFSHGVDELILNTVTGFQDALSRTLIGLGPGVDTVAARYGLPDFDPYALIGGHVKESWWVKLVLELGIAGLAIGVALLGTILVRGVRLHRRVRDPQLRSVSAAIVALIAFVLVSNFKASYLDLDPTNVYFWLLVGILLKLPSLEARPAEPAVSAADPHTPRHMRARSSPRRSAAPTRAPRRRADHRVAP